MGWGQKVTGGGGAILKWTATGQEVDGVLIALRTTPARGQYKEGLLLDLKKVDGEVVTVGVKTAMLNYLTREGYVGQNNGVYFLAKPGARLLITYTGKGRGSAGQEYHTFEFTPWLEDGQVQPPQQQAAPAPQPQQQQQAPPPPQQAGGPTFDTLKAALVTAKGQAQGEAIASAIESMGGDPAQRLMKFLIDQGVKF